jgi:hypothetical protein
MIANAYISVQDIIKTICLREGDNSMSMAAIYASYLPTVYNDLRLEGTKKTVTKKYYLDLKNNSLVLPNDCLLLVGVGTYDECGVVQPLWYNSKIPRPLLFENQPACNCDTCGEENHSCSLIASFDNVEEVVEIDRADYTNYVNTIILTDGTVIKKTRTYGYKVDDEGATTIEPFDTEEEVCVLDKLPCGCIANSVSNTTKINSLCSTSCSLNTCCGTYSCDIPVNAYRMDVQDDCIIMSPNYDKDYVIIKYVTALNGKDDYQIPSIAMETMIRGIKYYVALDNKKEPNYMRGQNSISHKAYTAEMNKLRKRLNPMNWDALMDALGVMSKNKQC